ncbi:GerAB/ArcD/ProY family transporter [Cohnella caldifontis]|uniref:GerAB/ArcD/ProY family transporter n=1 Tax=Cohnella caldifontis TaxID=3027471 RepID=UPI0023EA993D|nr:endospore germination permease [Cohnella sp. YIM B05605]
MRSDREITMIQLGSVVSSSIIGVGILPLPLFAVRAGGAGAPLVAMLGSMIGFAGIWLLVALGKRFPRETFVQYSQSIVGKWPAAVGSLLIIVYFTVLTAFGAREFGEVVITSVLKNTPVEVTVIVMLLLTAVSCRQDLTAFAYIQYFYLPVILVPAWLIVILSLKNADFINLLPLWGNEPQGIWRGGLSIANLFQTSFVISCIIPAMKHPNKALIPCVWGTVLAGAMYVAIVAAAVGVFGAEEIRLLLWPTLELAKTTSLPANVLERMDAAFLSIWVTAVFTTLHCSYTLTVVSMADLFKLKDYRALPIFLLPLVFMLAMQPQSIVQMYTTIHFIGQLGLLLTIGYPAVLLLIALARGKRSDGVDRKSLEKNGLPDLPASD